MGPSVRPIRPLLAAFAPVIIFPRPENTGGYLWPHMELRSILRTALLASIGPLFFGCSTDLDVTAPYKEITVVYSLLNKNDNIHWVKINKAYLGDGDAFLYAQIADSTEYTEEQLPEDQRRIEMVDADGNVVQTLVLRDTILDGRLDGLFNGPLHKMYYFRGSFPDGTLDRNYRYRLVATAKGNRVETITPIVNDLEFRSTVAGPGTEISFIQAQTYQPYQVRWFTTENGRRYEMYYRFHYDEVTDNATTPKVFDTFIGSVVSSNQNGQEDNVVLNGQLFYQTVANTVRYADPAQEAAVQSRIFRGIEFYAWVAAPDLHVYLQLANPISGIVEERPDYSNVTGGYGLFSSRVYRIVPTQAQGGDISQRKRLNDASITELEEGPITGSLRFCVPSPLSAPC